MSTVIAYQPVTDTDILAKLSEDLAETTRFYVNAYQIVYDREKLLNIPVTHLLATEAQARTLLPIAKEQAVDQPHIKNLRITKQVFLYSSENEPGRKEVLDQIVHVGGDK